MLDPSRQLAKVIATSGTATFLDIYGEHGPHDDPYIPNIGDEGFMYLDDAQTAQGGGDVLIHVENKAETIDAAR